MSDENSKIFTINEGNNGAEMPTLTSILYKRKAVKSDTSDKKGAFPSTELTSVGIQLAKNALQPPPLPADGEFSDTKIQPSPWMAESTGTLEFFKIEQMAEMTDLASQAIHTVSQGVKFHGALIFLPDPHRKGRLSSQRCVNLKPKEDLFKGMRMDPVQFQDLFSRLSTRGFAELPPTPTQNLANAIRAGFRHSFGVEGNQWLSLVRVGAPQHPEAVIAFFTDESLMGVMPSLKLTAA